MREGAQASPSPGGLRWPGWFLRKFKSSSGSDDAVKEVAGCGAQFACTFLSFVFTDAKDL